MPIQITIILASSITISTWLLYVAIGIFVVLLATIVILIKTSTYKANEAIVKERDNLRRLIDLIPDYLYVKDTKSRFLVANETVARNMNCETPQQLIGKTDFDFYQRDLAEAYSNDEKQVMSTNKPMLNKIEPSVNCKGKRIYIATTKIPLHSPSGKVIGLIGVGRNVTRERLAEFEVLSKSDAILKERNQLRTLIDNLPDCIFIKDINGRILVANKRLAEVVGSGSPEELLLKTDIQLFPKELAKRYDRLAQQVIQSGEVKTFEEPIVTASRLSIFGTMTLIPLMNGEREVTGIIGIWRDISNVKRVEYLKELNTLMREKQEEIIRQTEELNAQKEQLESSNSELQTLNSTKDRFFSIIAHDLKNPFFAITSLAEIIINDFNDLPNDEKIQLVQLIKQSAHKTYNLFENLLYWSRTQTNQIRFNPQIFDIRTIVDENLKFHEIALNSKSITLDNTIAGCQPILADRDMINLIMRNLLSNAVKFSEDSGTIKIFCDSFNDKLVKICIQDNGVGMDDDTISKLFRIDQNVTTTGTAGETGTGLGLIVCKEFATMNGGDLFVESSLGNGSTFSFTIPKASVS